jgi:predicted TIM-barrel fold metal-dependent hydrolase
MIVDAHAYCFTAPDTPAGHATAEDHLWFWQWAHAHHHQPAYRVRDRAPADASLLLDPDAPPPLHLAADRDFRVDRDRTRLVWTVDGEDVTKHFLPPNTIEYSAGQLIADMDYAGIDWALLHVDTTLSKDVAYQASVVRAHPDRLKSMATVDEWRIADEPDAVIREATEAIELHGLHALKIIPTYAYALHGDAGFDEPAWRPFWDAVTRLDVPIFFTLGEAPGSTDPLAGFLDEVWTLARWMDRYPGVRASITHGFPWRELIVGDQIEIPDAFWAPFRDRPDLSIEVSFPVRIGDLFDYPWRGCLPALEAMVERVGADRLLWGTDMPFQNRFCTYRQSREWIERYATFLDSGQLAAVMGGTAARILRIPMEADSMDTTGARR